MPVCSYHPDVETNLRCSRCEKYICPRELVQTPVGARCPECAHLHKIPTFDVRGVHYARAAAAAGGAAVGLGAVWGFLMQAIGGIPFVPWLVAVAVAYGIGEATTLSVNRKRGAGLAFIAGAAVVVAFAISGLVWAWTVDATFKSGIQAQFNTIWDLIILAIGIFIAVGRVRY